MAESLTIDDRQISLDKHGYLQYLEDWNESVAEVLALREAIKLSSEHWELINILRQFHQVSGLLPSTRSLVKLMRKELGEEKGSSAYLMSLFPQTPLKSLCKIAGLPRPTNCI
jgi:tRNA 2-thiouridine synthesizing protein E